MTAIRETSEYAAVLAEMRSWDGNLELRGSSGTDIFGRERRFAMSAYEHWAEQITAAVLEAQNGRTFAQKHQHHYTYCNCLGDSSECCDPSCQCHDE